VITTTLLIGGARAGKSRLAVRLANRTGLAVTFIATAEALDPEMTARIARHRADRPAGWETLEEPRALESALEQADDGAAVIVDCLTLWVSNLMLDGESDERIAERAGKSALVAARRAGPTFVVTNEVGSGIVPPSELGRRFRDVLGWVNTIWADESDDVFLVVAGRVLRLEPDP
jgi:adenosylcobinamide kinase/adenosylcobinamide-phosphate guanylyltransferase